MSIARAVGDRMGIDPDREMYPTLVTVWLLGAWRVALDRRPPHDRTTAEVRRRMRTAVRQLVAGIAVRTEGDG